MQKVKIFTVATLLVLMGTFIFTACKKNDKSSDTSTDTGIATDQAMLERNFNDVTAIADQAGTDGTLSTFRVGETMLSACAQITNDSTVTPHVLTIDFGNSNCLCADGKYRKGKILVSYYGRYRDSNFVHSVTFNNYFVNNNQITGTKSITSAGRNSLNQPVYNISINGSIILANSAGTITWTSTRTRTWVAGYNTLNWHDDEYTITGSGSVTRANGNTHSFMITNALDIALDCQWIRAGTVSITPNSGSVRTLDYGNGTCDNQATLTVNGTVYNITL